MDGACPIHGTPVDRVVEENYFFRLSRYQDRLLEHYTAHPEAVEPAGKRSEVLGLIKQGLLDFSISRTSISWGIPLPWDPAHVDLRVVRRAGELLHRDRVRHGSRAVRRASGRRTTTSSARTSCDSTRSTGRRC